ncbi:hypothetical protein M406DRAFT_334678 [Cryphonectria parasitica EP155]|uniref:Uncharacterized protein n=1 Tax=Cryphonectria parasitica (strain ATCC 38755 / EP155) TaxID=660469 RepID=A0A9P4XUN5_CRYP1|nr:uncharacterized protein M406DRAFT_334678 [Cryphonectria parasitica EP155]KAF3761065.1 hypothetical protein M406DRAFT_334678 [Cryphonectria parasitica EP155]
MLLMPHQEANPQTLETSDGQNEGQNQVPTLSVDVELNDREGLAPPEELGDEDSVSLIETNIQAPMSSPKAPGKQPRTKGTSTPGPQGPSSSADERTATKSRTTITFYEVYNDTCCNNVKQKQKLIEWPDGSGAWYIFSCDPCHLRWLDDPLLEARQHLSAPQHKGAGSDYDDAIREFGCLVSDCTHEDAVKNNNQIDAYINDGLHSAPSSPQSFAPQGSESTIVVITNQMLQSGNGTAKDASGATPESPQANGADAEGNEATRNSEDENSYGGNSKDKSNVSKSITRREIRKRRAKK